MYSLKEMVDSIKDIPAMPNIVIKALSFVRDPDVSVKDLAEIMSYDQALSTKILGLVNSAYYGFSQQITSINQAVVLLGLNGAKNIILAVAMKPMLTNQSDKELWEHSINVAVGCEYFAQKLKIMDGDEGFVIGFLHDIGKIILNIRSPKDYQDFKLKHKATDDIIEAERAIFKADHSQLGSMLAKKWKLPIMLTNAIKYHHDPLLSTMPNISALVYAVDKLVQDNYSPEMIDEDFVKPLGIPFAEIEMERDIILQKAKQLLSELV